MIVLSGAEVVLPDRILSPGTVVIDDDRIVEVRQGGASGSPASGFAFHGHYIVPGFIDVHVHGIEGLDCLGPGNPIADMAALLPRYGVTAFCPTTVACAPEALRRTLEEVRRSREMPGDRSARVLPAHLESNFINPEYRGAQPASCLRTFRPGRARGSAASAWQASGPAAGNDDGFDGADILREIERAVPDVGIVTMAPEIDGGLDLVAWLVGHGLRVSLGHSGASYEEALAAISAGARHATHLFNRMPPLDHRRPGLVGAVFQAEEVAAEIICDGVHVHPALVRTAIAAKRPSGVMAITDGTAAAGLPVGSRASLGSQSIVAGESAAFLTDGATLAGSILTMDRAFQTLVRKVGISPVDASVMCSTTPARELGLVGHGVIAADAVADLVVLDAKFSVVQTYVGGRLVYTRAAI